MYYSISIYMISRRLFICSCVVEICAQHAGGTGFVLHSAGLQYGYVSGQFCAKYKHDRI